ncbi:MAG: SPOR domain-containing protein [Clostridium sp.]
MKYTRVEIKNKFSKYKIIICFSVLLPICALLIGKVLIDYTKGEATSIAVKLDTFDRVYFIQLGVFENKEGAINKVEQLKKKSINSVILSEGKYYKVVNFIASNPKKLESKKNEYEELGIKTYIKDFPVNSLETSKDGNIKEYKTYIKEFVLGSIDGKSSVVNTTSKKLINIDKIEVDKKLVHNITRLVGEITNTYSTNDNTKLTQNVLELIVEFNKLP